MASALEGLLGSALGGLGGGGGTMGLVEKAAPAIIGMLAGGGAQKILQSFESAGLGGHAQSWVGTGENKSVTPEQVTQAMGQEEVGKFAATAGIPADQASAVLAQALPAAIDHVSPDGRLPEPAKVDQALAAPAAG